MQEWAQRAWAKHYPNQADEVAGREVAQVVKQVVGRQQTTIHSGMDASVGADDAAHFFPPSGLAFVSAVDPYAAAAADAAWARQNHRQYETDIAFSSLQMPAAHPYAMGVNSADAKLLTSQTPNGDFYHPPPAPPAAATAAPARRSRQRLFLPLPCRYLAWFLCAIASLAAAYFTISLGVNFGPKRSSVWLQAVYFALVQVRGSG